MHTACRTAFLIVLLISSVCQADYVIQSISNPNLDNRKPTLACSPMGTLVVAWAVEDFGIWTQAFSAIAPDDGDVTEPVYHGPGQTPAICWSAGGFVLAYTSDSQVIVRQGNGYTWSPSNHVIETGGILDWTRPDLTAVPGSCLDSVWLTFDVSTPSYWCDVWLVRKSVSGWQDPEIVAFDCEYSASPRVTAASGAGVLEPRVYYLCNFNELQYRQRSGTEWSEPVVVPGGYFGMEMDVATSPDTSQCILSLGPQLPCPCNDIAFIQGLPDGFWSFPEYLTVHYNYYDWPLYLAIEVAPAGIIHAFWYQIASDEEIEETHWSLEYKTREEGIWIDGSTIFSGHFGPSTDIALTDQGQPVFTWNRRSGGQNGEIMLARPDYAVAVAEQTPGRELTLTAWPNPFNPLLTISFAAPETGPTLLAVYDPRGQLVVTLESEPGPSSLWQTVWNGRDSSGRAMPSGTYFVRLSTKDAVQAKKVSLVR